MKFFSTIKKFFRNFWKSLFCKEEKPVEKKNFNHIKPSIFYPPYPGGPPEPRPPFKPPTPPPCPKPPKKVCTACSRNRPKRFVFTEKPHVTEFDFHKTDDTIQKIKGFRTEIENTGNTCPPDYVKVWLVVSKKVKWPFDFVNMRSSQIGIIQNKSIDKGEAVLFVLEPGKILMDILKDPKIHMEVWVTVGNNPVQKYPLSREEIEKLF